jgi:hypothetical protein
MVKKGDEKLQGGDADGKQVSEFPPKQVLMGIQEEREHTPDLQARAEITKDHLQQDKKYYSKLKRMVESKVAKSKDKFESCVQQVKEKNPGYDKDGKVNPWAICHAALKKSQRNKVCGWTEEDARQMLREAKVEELAKADVVDIRTRLRRKAGLMGHQVVDVKDEQGGSFKVHFIEEGSKSEVKNGMHRDLESRHNAETMLQDPAALRYYLDTTGILRDLKKKGMNEVFFHLPKGQ